MEAHLSSFLPVTVRQYLSDNLISSVGLYPPFTHKLQGTAMFADVSGFTALSEQLAAKGPHGAEELALYLNQYLSKLVAIIIESGGDIVKFAGDALIVLFRPPINPDDDEQEITDQDVLLTLHRAAQCALHIQSELHSYALADDVRLSIKLGLGVGHITVVHIGGVYQRLEYLCTGPPLIQAFQAEHACKAGETIMSHEAHEMIEMLNAFDFEEVEVESSGTDGKRKVHTLFKVMKQNKTVRDIPLKFESTKSEESSNLMNERMSRYIPEAVIPWIDLPSEKWMGELRRVTVLFISVGLKLGGDVNPEALAKVQSVVSAVQTAVYNYEGSVNKFLVDDKGSTMVCVFGLPPHAHENDPARGILCALQLRELLEPIKVTLSIGITSGIAYCGIVGSSQRCEYSVLGDTVNVSARLMQAAAGDIICDHETYLAARPEQSLAFRHLGEIQVKGKADWISIYLPAYVNYSSNAVKAPGRITTTFGRDNEIRDLLAIADELQTEKFGKVVIVEGDSGMGKSHLLQHVSHICITQRKMNVLWGVGDVFSRLKPFYVWKQLLTGTIRLFGGGETVDERQKWFQEVVAQSNPSMLRHLPVINFLLQCNFDEEQAAEDADAFEAAAKAAPKTRARRQSISVSSFSRTMTEKKALMLIPEALERQLNEHAARAAEKSILDSTELESNQHLKRAGTQRVSSDENKEVDFSLLPGSPMKEGPPGMGMGRKSLFATKRRGMGSIDASDPTTSAPSNIFASVMSELDNKKSEADDAEGPAASLYSSVLSDFSKRQTDHDAVKKKAHDLIIQLCVLYLRKLCGADEDEVIQSDGSVQKQSLILIIDQGDDLSSGDWDLLVGVCELIQQKKLPHITIILSLRTQNMLQQRNSIFDANVPITKRASVQKCTSRVIRVQQLNRLGAAQLIKNTLMCSRVDPKVVELAQERTGGNPRFLVKMMNTLTAINGFEFSYVNPPPGSQLSRSDSAFTRSASITGSTAAAVRAPKDNMNVAFAIDRLSKRVGDDQWQATLPVPFGIQRITMDRCSTLTTSQMWVLKIAAALSVSESRFSSDFCADDVMKAHPIAAYCDFVNSDLDQLVDAKFLSTGAIFQAPREKNNNQVTPIDKDKRRFRFAFGFLRDAIFQTLLFTQRDSFLSKERLMTRQLTRTSLQSNVLRSSTNTSAGSAPNSLAFTLNNNWMFSVTVDAEPTETPQRRRTTSIIKKEEPKCCGLF